MDLKEVKDDILSPIEDPTNTFRNFGRRVRNFSRGLRGAFKKVIKDGEYENAYRKGKQEYLKKEITEKLRGGDGDIDMDRIRRDAVFHGAFAGAAAELSQTPQNMRDVIKLSKGGLGFVQSVNELAHMPDMYKHSSASGHESALGMTPMEGETSINKLLKAARAAMAVEDVGIKSATAIVSTSKKAYSKFHAGPARVISNMFKNQNISSRERQETRENTHAFEEER